MVKISIIIPFFNCEKISKEHYNFHRLIISKINCELIYVDDYSTDNTYKNLKKIIYKDNKKEISIYKLNKNYGPGIARNFAIKKSLGNYLIFLDIDDRLNINLLKKILNKFNSKKKVDILFIGFKKKDNPQINLSKMRFSKKTLLKKYLRTDLDMNSNFYIFRKNFLLKNKIFFNKGYYEDIVFMLKCFFYSRKNNFFPERVYIKNNYKGSITNTFSEKHLLNFINSSKKKYDFFNFKMKSKLSKNLISDLQHGLRSDYCFAKKIIKKCKLKNNYEKKINNFYKKIIGHKFMALTAYDKIVKRELFNK